MDFALLTTSGLMFVLRWMHLFFGVTWIGLLYYFNFVQGPFFNETDAATKSNAFQKLVPRALWWFRWAAMWTWVSGFLYLMGFGHLNPGAFAGPWGAAILTGATMGTLMFANVWLIIWPNQKILIENATQTAKGGAALPAAAAAGPKALLASRTNTLLSIPMLFFMGAASHLPISIGENASMMTLALVFAAILGAIELNAIKGKTGPITTIKGVIHSGVALTVAMYILMEIIL